MIVSNKWIDYKRFWCLRHNQISRQIPSARWANTTMGDKNTQKSTVVSWSLTYTRQKFNRSPANFNIFFKIRNYPENPKFPKKYNYIRGDLSIFHFDRPIYSVSIAIQNGNPNFVKSHSNHTILRNGNGNLSFLRNKISLLNCKLFFSVQGNN